MSKQNVNIVNFSSLYEILDEIKENLFFNIINYETEKSFIKIEKDIPYDSLIIGNLNKDNLNKNNLLVLKNFPISLNKLIELININLIKLKFNYQSNSTIKNYDLNLNSKFISRDDLKLKLTEKEIEIILYLNLKKTKVNILDLQKKIWGYSSDLETHTVETHIYRLRKKINDKFNDKDFIISDSEGYFIEK